MAQQVSPYLEAAYGWNFGEGGWNTGMDQNLLKFSFMFDRNVDSITAALPAAVNGQAHYLTTDNRLYFAVGTTYFSTPVPKWFVIVVRSTGQTHQFNGTSLVQIDTHAQLDSRLDDVELTVSKLGTAAFEDIKFFATRAELDVAEATAAAYTNTLRSDIANNNDVTKGATLVGFDGTTINQQIKSKISRVVDSIATLKTLDKTKYTRAFATGYYGAGDGGGGDYWFDATDTTSADNGGTTIVAADGGRWKLATSGLVSLRQFGARGDSNGSAGNGTDDRAAMLSLIAYAAANPCKIDLGEGTYRLTGEFDITALRGCAFVGRGTAVSRLFADSTTATLFKTTAIGGNRVFRDFSIIGNTARTSGFYFDLFDERSTIFENVKAENWKHFMWARAFIHVTMDKCEIANPCGPGNCIDLGSDSATNTGANFTIANTLLRGVALNTFGVPVGTNGIVFRDAEALFLINTDISAFALNDLLVVPTTRAANIYATQAFFDATGTGDCVNIAGAGTKESFSFSNCWFSSAGVLNSGIEACGVRIMPHGALSDIQFSGCKIRANNGSGILIENSSPGVNISGCDVFSNGRAAATNRYGVYVAPSAVQTTPVLITGCNFGSNGGGFDILLSGNSRLNHISGNRFDQGLSNGGGVQGGGGSNSTNKAMDIAAASTLVIEYSHDFINVTGAVNIDNISTTYPGHRITLLFNGALTVADNTGNLRLNGNLVTGAGTVLSLVADKTGVWFETGRLTI